MILRSDVDRILSQKLRKCRFLGSVSLVPGEPRVGQIKEQLNGSPFWLFVIEEN